jgi:glycine/D-amino acid oxidase-like deaminating enzyme
MTAQQHGDVVVVGAGISGIGAAYHLQQRCRTLITKAPIDDGVMQFTRAGAVVGTQNSKAGAASNA